MSILVIVPFRGTEQELSECIQSVRASKNVEFRILVLDDRPAQQQIPEFLSSGEYIQTNGIGLPAVIEISKSYVNEQFVALLAGDDLMSTNRLNLQLREIEKENSEICLGRMQKFSAEKNKIESLTGNPSIIHHTKNWLLLGAYGADGTIFMTKEFYLSKYTLDPHDSYSDWVLAIDNYPNKIAYVPESIVLYRQHNNQVTRNKRTNLIESKIYASWAKFFFAEFNVRPEISDFHILAAPWYRTSINSTQIKGSLIYFNLILNDFKSKNYEQEEIDSLEQIILRRLIFRLTIGNLLIIWKTVKQLKIENVQLKFMLECLRIGYYLVKDQSIKPRRVKPE